MKRLATDTLRKRIVGYFLTALLLSVVFAIFSVIFLHNAQEHFQFVMSFIAIITVVCFMVIAFFVRLLIDVTRDFETQISEVYTEQIEQLHQSRSLLDASKKSFELIFAAAPNIMMSTNVHKIFKANRAMLDFFNIKSIEMFKAEHGCICELFLEEEGCIGSFINGEYWLEYIAKHPDQTYKVALAKDEKKYYFKLSVNQLGYQDDEEVYLVILSDITEIELAKERLEYALRGSSDGLWDWNLVSNEVYFSPRWKEMLGYRDEELPCRLEEWEKRVHPDDLARAVEQIHDAIERKTKNYQNIHRLRHKDGHWVWILDRGNTVVDKNGQAIRMLGFHTDISNLKTYEQEMLQKDEIMIAQSRHAAMGEMISMIAHQWRQPISVISMEANNILADVELGMLEEKILKESAEGILKQTEELSRTIDDFRNFFRPNKIAEKILLKDILEDAFGVMGSALDYSEITLRQECDENIELTTYSRELMQVFINILKNAKEALVENQIPDKQIWFKACKDTQKVFIEICDNAKGIKPQHISKIFEPYFTTKCESDGTGLGLYMSKIIVEKHLQGKISVRNVEEGACFYIELPLVLKMDKRRE